MTPLTRKCTTSWPSVYTIAVNTIATFLVTGLNQCRSFGIASDARHNVKTAAIPFIRKNVFQFACVDRPPTMIIATHNTITGDADERIEIY
jgi:hypothetical protein